MEGVPRKSEENSVQKLQNLNLESILEANNGKLLEEGRPAETIEIDSSLESELSPELLKNVRMLAFFSSDYLTGPIVLDKFGDEEIDPWVRRGWRENLIHEYGDDMKGLLELNRMKPNRMMPLLTQADRLKEKLLNTSPHTLRTEQLAVLVSRMLAPVEPLSDFGQKYIHMPLQERIDAVQKISGAAREFIQTIEEKGDDVLEAA